MRRAGCVPWRIALRRYWRRWTQRASLGRRGEDAAARFLRCKGYRIVERSRKFGRGELDLVAVDGRTIVFVEVKTRQSHAAGHPTEAVDTAKQRRLARLALVFLRRHGLLEYAARFDVVAVTWPENARQPTIQHYQNAFEPPGRGQMFA